MSVESEGDVTNDNEITLAYDVIERDRCDVIGPGLGKRLLAMLRANSSR